MPSRICSSRESTVNVAIPISGWKLFSLQKKKYGMAIPPFYKYLVGAGLCVSGGLALLAFFLARNILKQKLTQFELKRTQKIYLSIFQNAVMGIFQSTLDGHFLDANPSMAKILGFKNPRELLSKITHINHQVYVRSKDRDRFIEKVLKKGQVKEFETKFYTKDNKIIWVQLSGRVAQPPVGNDVYLEGFCIDYCDG